MSEEEEEEEEESRDGNFGVSGENVAGKGKDTRKGHPKGKKRKVDVEEEEHGSEVGDYGEFISSRNDATSSLFKREAEHGFSFDHST